MDRVKLLQTLRDVVYFPFYNYFSGQATCCDQAAIQFSTLFRIFKFCLVPSISYRSVKKHVRKELGERQCDEVMIEKCRCHQNNLAFFNKLNK